MNVDVNDLQARLDSAGKLVRKYPELAASLLAQKYDKDALEYQILKGDSRALDTSSETLSLQGSRSTEASSIKGFSQSSGSPPRNQNRTSLHSAYAGQPTPPTSVKSASHGGRKSDSNTILVYDSKYKLKIARLGKTIDSNNWVSQNLISRLELEDDVCEGEDIITSTLCPGLSNDVLRSKHYIELNWCTPQNDTTVTKICHVVQKPIKADVIIGAEVLDAPERIEEPTTGSAQPDEARHPTQLQFDGTVLEATLSRPGSVCTAKQSAQSPSKARPSDNVTSHQLHQQVGKWASTVSGPEQRIPSPTVVAAATHSPRSASPMTHTLRINISWDGNSLNANVDLDSSGQILLDKLQRAFQRRRNLDRNAFHLHLLTDRDAESESTEETFVSFRVDNLEEDWSLAAAWIRDKSGLKIFGRIEPGDPPGS